MKLEISSKSAPRKALLEVAVPLFVKLLGLQKSTFKLKIITVANLAKSEKMSGGTFRAGPKEIVIGLDSGLKLHDLTHALAHEMVHAKQHAKGQLVQRVKRSGKTEWKWLGKVCTKEYYKTPWELEAYAKERNLANELFALIDKIK